MTMSTLNGFKTVPEVKSLVVADENIAPFSLPQEVLSYTPEGLVVVHTFKNGDKERKIHCNRELEQKELQGLRVLRKLAANSAFFPSLTTMATRYISRARGDEKKAFKLLEETQKWRATFFEKGPVTDKQVFDDMQHGIMYFTGRDLELRPTIVIRACRIPPQWYKENKIDTVLRLLIFCMEYMLRYMVYPGRVENNNVIVDLKGLGISQVPIGALRDIYGIMSHHYMGRVYKFYICNMSMVLGTIAGAVKGLLTDRQKQKLVFVDKIPDLLKDFAAHHLEQDLGGTRPVIKEKFFPFPLQPGPFKPGTSGPDRAAIPNVHEIFTEFGVSGRLYDSEVPENDADLPPAFTAKAASIFRQAGVLVPKEAEVCESQTTEAANSSTAPVATTTTTTDGESKPEEPTSLPPAAAASDAPVMPDSDIPTEKSQPKEEASSKEESANSPPILRNPIPPVETGNPALMDSKQGAMIEEDVDVHPAGFFTCGACFAKACRNT
mmetsp:Transcript_24949/g.57942  ORF Transcript_24949/g.57942 Transcript_24949/m.57942 type:complete len:494 (-) Transcript_24949:155-1636(-)